MSRTGVKYRRAFIVDPVSYVLLLAASGTDTRMSNRPLILTSAFHVFCLKPMINNAKEPEWKRNMLPLILIK